MVHGDFTADGTIDHRQKRCRELDERDAALVCGGAKARHVAYDATAELQKAAFAGVTAVQHKAVKLVQVMERLVAFASLELENGAASCLATEFRKLYALFLGNRRVGANQEFIRWRETEAFEHDGCIRDNVLADENRVAPAFARIDVQRMAFPELEHVHDAFCDMVFGAVV